MTPCIDDLNIMAPCKARQHVANRMPSLRRVEFDHQVHPFKAWGKLRVKEFPLGPFNVAPYKDFFASIKSFKVLGGKQAADFHIRAIACGKRFTSLLGAGVDIVGKHSDGGKEPLDANGIVAFGTADIENRRIACLHQAV